MYEEHQKEIQRRKRVKEGRDEGGSFSQRGTEEGRDEDSCSMPFNNEQQAYVVYSLSQGRPDTNGLAPYPVDLSNPGLCLYGAFPTAEEAREHALEVSDLQKWSVLIGRTHVWNVGIRDAGRIGKEQEVVERMLRREEGRREEEREDFETNVSKLKEETTEKDEDEEGGDEKEERPSKRRDGGGDEERKKGTPFPEGKAKARRAKAGTEVRGQKFAVLSVLPDPLCPSKDKQISSPEFLFRVYAFFETEAEASSYAKNVAGEEVFDHDIDVVLSCEWIFPQSMGDNALSDVYRDEELDKIMKFRKNQPKEVERYKRWKDKKMEEQRKEREKEKTAEKEERAEKEDAETV